MAFPARPITHNLARINEIVKANSRSKEAFSLPNRWMALVQKLMVDYLTFGEITGKILSRVLHKREGSNRVDVVFDVYRDIYIKSAERELRGENDAVTFKNLTAGQKVKQFKNFLRNGDNKTSPIRFVVNINKNDRVESRLVARI